ncbi:hypothetical protein QQ73_19285 [Candidatus Endoriftia persephone str. Guaymas]|nr:hypothetical protein [Candidatus Endoriftia persephone str. Guaymas]
MTPENNGQTAAMKGIMATVSEAEAREIARAFIFIIGKRTSCFSLREICLFTGMSSPRPIGSTGQYITTR